MSSFPPKNWQVRHLTDLDQYELDTPAKSTRFSMEALLVAKPASGQEGNFRLVLGGNEKLLVEVDVYAIWADEAFKDMTVMMDIQNGTSIQLQKNSATTRWADVEELVKAQEVDVVDQEGEDASELFLETWERLRKTHFLGASIGLVWRWAISATEDGSGMEILLQALPVNINHIKNVSELRQASTLV